MASIQFFSFAPIVQRNGRIDSDLASARYRVIQPATQLARRGHKINLAQVPPDATGRIDPASITADVVVFSKSLSPAVNEPLAAALRERGKRVVIDQCDNYFEHAQLGDKYRDHNIAMCRLADTVIASTPTLAAVIAEHTGTSPVVISDPVEGPRGEACFAPRFPRVRLLWFGHNGNWNSLQSCLPALMELAADCPLQLTIVTRATDAIRAVFAKAQELTGERLPLLLDEWSTETLWRALADCDLVIIPSGMSDFHAAKSPNRLAEALWAGRHVVAHPLPSYQPFAGFATLTDDLAAGIRQAIEHPEDIPERIRQGQAYIAQHHSPYAIGSAWEQALGLSPASRPLRLNLGCGDKILPDYVNVDAAESRKGVTPDVLCDLHRLSPFADDSVDEILAVNVVEHFWRWEARDILREWARVLKPGGRMILECPDLEAACRHLLENPGQHARDDQNGDRSMWMLYGDPRTKDPAKGNRWGYTSHTLGELMKEAGLASTEPAENPRVEAGQGRTRMIGTKPEQDKKNG